MNLAFLMEKIMENENKFEILESVVVKSEDVMISICGSPDGLLNNKTSDQVLMFCSDILRQASGDGTIEESFQIPETIRDTLVLNYGWSDLDYNEFVRIWRKNIYLKKIGSDNQISVDLEEYNRFIAYLEKKKKKELGEIVVGSETDEEEFAKTVVQNEAAEALGPFEAAKKNIKNENGAIFVEGERVSEINLNQIFTDQEPSIVAPTPAVEEFEVAQDNKLKNDLKKGKKKV
jgi:hypothetical protein